MKKKKSAPSAPTRSKTTRKSAAQKPTSATRAKQGAVRRDAVKRSAPAAPHAKAPRRTLYPAIEPFRHGFLRVSEIHEIY